MEQDRQSPDPPRDEDERRARGLLDVLQRELAGEETVVAGRYVLGDRIGAGAHGSVHAAVDRLTGERVAVKLLPPLADLELVRLRGEIAALRLLRLPGVVHLFDEGVDHGRPFLVMERVDGAPFPGALPEGATCWTWEALRGPTLALLDTLARVHAAGLVHRDLKPRNVLVTAAGRPVLLDFGLSVGRALSEDSASDTSALGTPAYAAPEQVRGEPVDARADLYSLGVMLWEALAGRRPHEGPRVSGILRSRLEGPAPPLAHAAPSVPGDVADVVDSLLEVERKGRPRSAVEVAERLAGREATEGRQRLLFVGHDEPLQILLAAARTQRSVHVVGEPGSGRTRLLQEAAARLESEGRPVLWAQPASRPFESLDVLAGWVADREPPTLEAAQSELVRALAAAFGAGLVLVADDFRGLDKWSQSVLARNRDGALLTSGGLDDALPPGTARVLLAPLAVASLQALFLGDDRLLHVHEDAALELHQRTEGRAASVQAELDAWTRAGLAEPVGDRVRMTRADVDRLRGGVQMLPVATLAVGTLRPLDDDVDELLAWIHLGWPATQRPLLARLAGLTAWLLDAELQQLIEAGSARVLPDGRVRPLRPARRLADALWLEQAKHRAHSELGVALPEGAAGRLYHLVAAGEHAAAVREALVVARAQLVDGRLGEAEVALVEGLHASRRLTSPEDLDLELEVLRGWIPVALGDVTPVACDRLLYEASRSQHRGAALLHLERLVRAAIAAYDKDGAQALAIASAVPPFDDDDLERWRQALRVRAARRGSLADEERVVAEACRWAESARSTQPAASRDEWAGRLRYRQGRFAEAAELGLSAAAGASSITARLSALLNAASALLENADLDTCEAVALRAQAIAARCRHSWFEGRAIWLARSAAYRRGEDLEPDVGLVDALVRVGAQDQFALAALSEAVFAWRRRDHALGADLAGRCVRAWSGSGFRDGYALAHTLQCLCLGAPPTGPDAARLLDAVSAATLPRAAAQTCALLRLAGVTVPEALRRRALDGDWRGPVAPRRFEVLSPAEIEQLLAAPDPSG